MRHGWVLSDGHIYLDRGAYADIFVDRDSRRVRKVFRAEKSRDHVEQVFQSELTAYEIAAADQATAALIPNFYGRCASFSVLDNTGKPKAELYFSDLAYELEWIGAPFQKIGTIDPREATRIREAFWSVGIMHMTDASVAFVDGGLPKVIDFATEEFELWH